jgi:hypothetical protein
MDKMRTLTRSVVNYRSVAAENYFKRTTYGFKTDNVLAGTVKDGYPPVELERKLFAFLVGSNREQDQPDQNCALIRAASAEKNTSSMYDRQNFLKSMLDILVQGIEAQLERVPDFAQDREVNMRELEPELTTLILKFVLPDVKAPALNKEPALKKEPAIKEEPGEPPATGKRGGVEAQPVVKEEPGNAATTSKRARRGK